MLKKTVFLEKKQRETEDLKGRSEILDIREKSPNLGFIPAGGNVGFVT